MEFIKEKFGLLIGGFARASLVKKIIILAILVVAIGVPIRQIVINSQKSAITYQTEKATKGTLVVSVSASGQVSEANSASITTEASGVVSKVYVQNGQKVQSGDKIAEIDLDMNGKQRQSSAWASYISAKNSLASAQDQYYSLQSSLLTNWKTYMDKAQNSTYTNSDGSDNTSNRQLTDFVTTQDNWLSAEATYKRQADAVTAAQNNLQSAWISYQQSSSTIYAPIPGTVTGLTLQIGSVLTSQSTTTGAASSQDIANIQTGASPIIKVSVGQVDIPKVKIGNQASVVFDAFPDKTYTGKIISVDTTGSVSSNVTSYTAAIKLDNENDDIYSNMTATATIITSTTGDVILVPSTAVSTNTSGNPTIQVMKNGKPSTVTVTIGDSNDTQTIIKSGLSEGDEVVTSVVSNADTTSSTTSLFGTTKSSSTSNKSSSSGAGGIMMGGPPGM